MGKLPLVAIIVPLIAIAGVVGFLALSRLGSMPGEQGAKMLDEVPEAEAPQSLRQLMRVSANQMCTYTDSDGGDGTIYVGGGKMRGDFTSTTEGEAQSTHMISDSTGVYMWFDGAPTGYKMTLADQEKFTDSGDGSRDSVDLDRPVDLSCSQWTVDNSKFDLPDITFADFAEMMEGLDSSVKSQLEETESSDSGSTDKCSVCDNVPEDSKAQCLAALGC